jgi:nucleoside-diphosphate-sugar epimerase
MHKERKITPLTLIQPNGTLGEPVIRNLLKAGFNITAITRDIDKTLQAFPSIKAIYGDYTSASALAPSLRNDSKPFDALVSLLNRDQVDAQTTVLNAAALAGIPHIIPSEFGIDLSPPKIRSMPCYATKVAMEDYMLRLAGEGKFTFTAIHTGLFFDLGLERGVPVNLLGNGQPTRIFDGGETRFSTTAVETIGLAVAAALVKHFAHPEEVRNRFLYVNSAAVTQNQLLRYAGECAPDKKFETVDVDTAQLYQAAAEKFANGETGPWLMHMMFSRVTFGLGLGFFEKPDNEFLGVPVWNEEQVRDLIGKVIAKHQSS